MKRMKKKEQNRKDIIDKNKAAARTMKLEQYLNMQKTKEQQRHKLNQVKERKLKNKLQRTIIENGNKDYIKERLERERKNSQANLELIKDLEVKEAKLLSNLQTIVNDSREIIDHAKNRTYLSFYYDQLPKVITENRNVGYTNRNTSGNKQSKYF